MTRKHVFAAAASLTLVIPFAAHAHSEDERAETVSYADLDLSAPADMRRLERRIRAAAARACAPVADRGIREKSSFDGCYAKGVESGFAKIQFANRKTRNARLASAK